MPKCRKVCQKLKFEILSLKCRKIAIFFSSNLYFTNIDTIPKKFVLRAVDGKRFLESNASSIPGTYFRLD